MDKEKFEILFRAPDQLVIVDLTMPQHLSKGFVDLGIWQIEDRVQILRLDGPAVFFLCVCVCVCHLTVICYFPYYW